MNEPGPCQQGALKKITVPFGSRLREKKGKEKVPRKRKCKIVSGGNFVCCHIG